MFNMSTSKTISHSQNNLRKDRSTRYNAEIKASEEDIESGNFNSHNEVKNNIEQWKKKCINPKTL
ncbi:hypothetical protein AR687_10305 [Flavobacteriaceae bacterium CRH]|nr:hypothetical protein AR687_10305 [Flavobacteriaceae bacterium CRH]